MIYIIHGEGISASREQILKIQKKANAESKLEISLSDLTPSQLIEKLSAFDMFGAPPFIVVDISNTHFSKYESFVKVLNELPVNTNLIIFSTKELSKTNAFIKASASLKAIVMQSEPEISGNIFKFVDSIFYKNKDLSYQELNKLLVAGEDPFYLFSMILYGLRNVASAGLESPSFAKMAPFLKGKAVSQSKNFTTEELVSIFSSMYQLDKDVKTGNIPAELLIPVVIEKIIKTSNT